MTTPQQPGWEPGPQGSGYGPPPAPAYGPPPQPGQVPPYGYAAAPQPGQAPPPHGYGQGAPRTETKAMIALGLAIAAYTPTIPFLGAIAALVLARIARREIRASGGALTGLSLCTWATALSILHLVFCALFVLLFFGLFLLPFSII